MIIILKKSYLVHLIQNKINTIFLEEETVPKKSAKV